MTSKKKITSKIILASIGVLGCVGGLIFGNATAQLFGTFGLAGDYVLDLNSSKKISNAASSYTTEVSANVSTAFGNNVTFKASNVINYDSGWQTICSGGYFYNPINNAATKNKLSGVTSVKFESSNNSDTLSLYYGNSLDGENIIYSNEKTLNANTLYTIGEDTPNYIFIKNNGASNVNVTKFTINYSCADSGYAKQNYKVLMIGNSFSDDTVYFAKRIANSYGISLDIYDAYIAGCTIDQHNTNINNGSATYSMRSTNDSSWVYANDKTLVEIINYRTWDVVTFQQASAQVGRSDSYSNLTNLVNAVRTRVGSGPKFYWYQTWAYDKEYHDANDYFAYFNNDQIAMYNAINTCYQNQVASTGLFDKLIPGGTAIQNMRTSYMKDTISRDGKHVSTIHGRYLLGLNFISHVLDINLDMSPCSYKPTQASDDYKTLCYEAVRNAFKAPLVCTSSVHTTQSIGNHILNDYTEIDPEFLGCSYWNSTDGSNYNKRIANASGLSNKYVTTKRFTPSTLPVGSFIVVGEAYGYRPEAWASDAAQGSRPNESYEKIIEIDSNFWSGYQYRAFNIFKPGETGPVTLADNTYGVGEQYSQIFDNFHVYVPNSLVGNIKTKGDNSQYVEIDTGLFESKGLNIEAFERVFLDPITGFMKCDSYYTLYNSYSDDTAKKFVCTRAFYSANGDLPANTVIIVDSGYQWRSDCWTAYGTYSNRPNNVTNTITVLDSSFMSGFRRRTFNVSSTNGYYVNQDHINFLNHMRIYVPTSSDITIPDVPDIPDISNTDYPEGTFKGAVNVKYSTYQFSVDLVIAIGNATNNRVAVMVSNSNAVATSISFNNSTKQVVINTTGTITYSILSKKVGKITGTYNKATNSINNISVDGNINTYVQNNGSITVTRPTSGFYGCEGTSSQLRSKFIQRVGNPWNLATNLDHITANTSNYVSGSSALNFQSATSRTALALGKDYTTASSATNIHFWVYNPSGSDITFRTFFYKAQNFNSNFEIGSLTAKANGWTYCAMGFGTQSSYGAFYNFQIANFDAYSTSLIFDNIYLF